MRKYILTFAYLLCVLSLPAQNSAESLLQKTLSSLEKDGGIYLVMDAKTIFDDNTEIIDLELKMMDGCFFVQEDDNMRNGKDFGNGIEEIYISEPTPEEKARYDVISLLGKHQGFSVTGNGTDTFTLTASTPERSVEGIRTITVKVDAKSYRIKPLQIDFDQQLGNISASVEVTEYKPAQKYDKTTFTCPVKDFKDAEVIDLR